MRMQRKRNPHPPFFFSFLAFLDFFAFSSAIFLAFAGVFLIFPKDLGGLVQRKTLAMEQTRYSKRAFRELQNPKGPKIEKNQSRLKFSIPLEIFNLD